MLTDLFHPNLCIIMSQYAHLSTPDPEYAALFAKIPYREPAKDVKIVRERVTKYFISTSKEHFRPHLPQGTCLILALCNFKHYVPIQYRDRFPVSGR